MIMRQKPVFVNTLNRTGLKYLVYWLITGSCDIASYRMPSSSWTLLNEMWRRVTVITRKAGRNGQEVVTLNILYCERKLTRVGPINLLRDRDIFINKHTR